RFPASAKSGLQTVGNGQDEQDETGQRFPPTGGRTTPEKRLHYGTRPHRTNDAFIPENICPARFCPDSSSFRTAAAARNGTKSASYTGHIFGNNPYLCAALGTGTLP